MQAVQYSIILPMVLYNWWKNSDFSSVVFENNQNPLILSRILCLYPLPWLIACLWVIFNHTLYFYFYFYLIFYLHKIPDLTVYHYISSVYFAKFNFHLVLGACRGGGQACQGVTGSKVTYSSGIDHDTMIKHDDQTENYMIIA